jgi:hypothetical protein
MNDCGFFDFITSKQIIRTNANYAEIQTKIKRAKDEKAFTAFSSNCPPVIKSYY